MKASNGFSIKRCSARAAGWIGLALLSALAGCAGSDGPPLVSVTGTVTRGGEPLSGANVMFIPETGAPSGGQTDAEGHFTLKFTDGRPGAVVGRHRVNITVPSPEVPPPMGGETAPPKPVAPPFEFHAQQEIVEGGNELTFEVGQ